MPDREKVINGLRCIKGDTILCRECDYADVDGHGNYSCKINCAIDAITLLKEREAENGEWITIWREDDPDTSTHARCSICNRISERPLGGYCKWCGAKMNI